MASQICPKCNKSRQTLTTDKEQDGKVWRIEYCPTCHYNFDLEEVKREIGFKPPVNDDNHNNWDTRGGWRI